MVSFAGFSKNFRFPFSGFVTTRKPLCIGTISWYLFYLDAVLIYSNVVELYTFTMVNKVNTFCLR